MSRKSISLALFGTFVFATTSACVSFGGSRLNHDQVDYARALGDARRRQTLANIVGLRYADTPSLLPVTQVIAAYTFDVTASGLVSGTSSGVAASSQIGPTVGYSNHPTFTFTPTTGEAYAEGHIRPMAPSLVLPLVQSGVPIDLLLRIVAQSIGDLQNSAALSGPESSGSPEFFDLIHALRRMQLKGATSIRFARKDGIDHVYLELDPSQALDSDIRRDASLVRRLLHFSMETREVEIVYGSSPTDGKSIGIQTRSVLGLLTEIGAQIEVPDAEVIRHATFATVRTVGVETRPTIVVRVGDRAPSDAFIDIIYGGKHYWIDRNDFDSKFAFGVVQDLIALAEASQGGKAPVVTIPAG